MRPASGWLMAAAMVVALGCKQPPREFTNSVGMRFVRIEPGSFKMGSEADGPAHAVTLSKGFYLQTTEVTQAQWRAVMGTDPSHFKGPDRPVERVSWENTQEFLRKLNTRERDTRYRLPTEAEWEYACRAGGKEPDIAPNVDDLAWWQENSGGRTHPVGRKRANAWGLYDMRGNVWEWVQDWYGPYPADGRQVDPQGPPPGGYRAMRGGACCYDLSSRSRCSYHDGHGPFVRSDYVGLRCARSC